MKWHEMMVLLLIITLTAFQKRPHLLLFHLLFSPLLRRKPSLPKMKRILKKRSTCRKSVRHPICQTLNLRRGLKVRWRKMILK
jgi:hypothetical protein